MDIGKEEGERFENVCYAPVVGVGEKVTIDKCLIQSIYGFFGHNMANFLKETEKDNFTVNYLNKLDLCLT